MMNEYREAINEKVNSCKDSERVLTQNERELLEIINNHPNKEFAILKAIEIVSDILKNGK